jgi:RNA polymerase primary sigma factor
MKQKYEGKDLQSLVDLGREQGYLTFDQVNDFLPQDVTSPTDLRSALESFEDMDIKVLDDVPSDGVDADLETEAKEESEEIAEPAASPDSLSESSDPVRLYLKEMGNFQLLSREQEVEIAKRIEAGENEVEDEVLRSPVTLDFVIQMGQAVEAGEADLRDIFEENEEAHFAAQAHRGTRRQA